jgi:hypothetical protein
MNEQEKTTIKNLIKAIQSNTDDINIRLSNGQNAYQPMINLQYINDELQEVKSLLTNIIHKNMTLEELRAKIRKIEKVAHDDERAHSMEDYLQTEVLKEIANGNPEYQQLAQEVLKTSKISFARWYA